MGLGCIMIDCDETLDPYLKQYLLGETRQGKTRQKGKTEGKARQGRARQLCVKRTRET